MIPTELTALATPAPLAPLAPQAPQKLDGHSPEPLAPAPLAPVTGTERPTAAVLVELPVDVPVEVIDDDEDDDGETVVVDRRPRIVWRLTVDGVGDFPITGEHVLLGRKPTSANGTQALAIPDVTRTLSKVHARLDLVDGAWVITDLNSTNGVMISSPDGTEHLVGPGETVAVPGPFVLGKVNMSIGFEGPSS